LGLRVAKNYYFFYFAAIGSLAPFFNLYLQQIGLSGVEIGWLGSIPPLIALMANPFWGAVADRWQIHRLVLALCAFGGGAVSLLFLSTYDFWLLMVLVSLLSFFRTPIGYIVDSTVMDLIKQTHRSYGRQRLWGTFGFVITTLGLSQLLTPDNLSLAFWLHGILLGLICAGLSLALPVKGAPVQTGMWHGIRILTSQTPYFTFLIAMALQGMSMAAFMGFLGLHILSLGGTPQQVGLAWVANSLPEVVMMYFGERWLAGVSHKRLILAGFLGIAFFWGAAALAPTPTLIIAVLPGVGLCFGFLWVAAVGYASEAAPPGMSATAQTLMGAAQSGLGWGLGSIIAGFLWDNTNGHVTLFFAPVCLVLGAFIFWLGNRSPAKKGLIIPTI
jgi:MFS transporter, PPP family, 3-phenylpropionic acid transporter